MPDRHFLEVRLTPKLVPPTLVTMADRLRRGHALPFHYKNVTKALTHPPRVDSLQLSFASPLSFGLAILLRPRHSPCPCSACPAPAAPSVSFPPTVPPPRPPQPCSARHRRAPGARPAQPPALLHLRLGDYPRLLCFLPTDVPRLRSSRGHPAAATSIPPRTPPSKHSASLASTSYRVRPRAHRSRKPPRALSRPLGMSVTPTVLRNLPRHLSTSSGSRSARPSAPLCTTRFPASYVVLGTKGHIFIIMINVPFLLL